MHAALVSFALVLAVVLFVIFGLLVLSVAGCVLRSFSFSHAFSCTCPPSLRRRRVSPVVSGEQEWLWALEEKGKGVICDFFFCPAPLNCIHVTSYRQCAVTEEGPNGSGTSCLRGDSATAQNPHRPRGVQQERKSQQGADEH